MSNHYAEYQKSANRRELDRQTGNPNAERAEVLQGKDMLEAAINTTEIAAGYLRPQRFYPEQFHEAVSLAIARSNVALAAEIRLLRQELQAHRMLKGEKK